MGGSIAPLVAHAQEPVAAFTTGELIACQPPAVVSFNNNSTPGGMVGGTTYVWDFGDGSVVNVRDPLPHLYATLIPGGYTVTLTVTTGSQSDEFSVAGVAAPAVLTPSFTQDARAGCGQLRVCFTDTSSGNTLISAREWRFGDGTTSAADNPCHDYTAPGVYDVELHLTNLCGTSSEVVPNAVVVVSATDPPQSDAHCADPECNGSGGVCVAATCEDGRTNGDETDVDCGGSCEPCVANAACVDEDDCRSGVCGANGFCARPTCFDGVQNGNETDTDCGGVLCVACDGGDDCLADADCVSQICFDMGCATPDCDDGVQNGDETGLDCGGSCEACENGQGCLGPDDCESGLCDVNLCVDSSCADSVQAGDETDVDCGGSCRPCDTGGACLGEDDCASGVCRPDVGGGSIHGFCAEPTCDDRVQNANESDVDCGGQCPLCDNGATCTVGADCNSGFCPVGLCREPTCDDGQRNGDESGVDCGGSCGPCFAGDPCLNAFDCDSGVCEDRVCAAPTCQDGARNGDEVAIDCGGSCEACPVCVDDRDCTGGASPVCDTDIAVCVGCVVDGDCASDEVCRAGGCVATTEPAPRVSFNGGGGCQAVPAAGGPWGALMWLVALVAMRRRRARQR